MDRAEISRWTAALALLALSGPLLAHHGTAGAYDQTKTLKIDGTVQQFIWRNPHSELYVISKNAAAPGTVTYALELGAPEALIVRGFTRTTFKPGDHVVAMVHPAFNHPTYVEMLEDKYWVNGKELIGSARSDE
jgi:hypothetical protein